MQRHARSSAIVLCLLITTSGQAEERPTAPPSRGRVHANVSCRDKPSLHYNLYVPRSLAKDSAAPVLIVFSSEGNAPVACFRAAAERVGWIVCGSVESTNDPKSPKAESVYQAIRRDVYATFSIETSRTYVAGLSGGSQKAFRLAEAKSGEIAGVIGIGGVPNDPPQRAPSSASPALETPPTTPAYSWSRRWPARVSPIVSSNGTDHIGGPAPRFSAVRASGWTSSIGSSRPNWLTTRKRHARRRSNSTFVIPNDSPGEVEHRSWRRWSNTNRYSPCCGATKRLAFASKRQKAKGKRQADVESKERGGRA